MIGLVPKLQTLIANSNLPKFMKDKLTHPAGPLTSKSNIITVFFWAPTFKWAITFANIKDLKVPAENLSLP